ncbi:MAG: outer membrane protein assembly factor BamE [Woeseia sp.]|nr:outer membrane protein assembly factor BamE [Woeseia sp.]MBT8095403.1 outer membrane protein assembly factor BamE [Woeseia sp.]NNE61545.1 outer membrane protein assembly factor BamE [Woeseia sp.]NNL55170.1 outer membrane protein assembly factor BamE [Woeseia sp.]
MPQNIVAILTLLLTMILAGCVYQAPLSQGNLLDDKDLEQIEIGMTRGQVRFLLGTPMIDDPFHKNRWDYVYYMRIGREQARAKRWVSVYFDGDTVSLIEKDRELNPQM